MPKWIHSRAEHLLAKDPSMSKSQAFAIATQQAHKLGKTPKGFGTKEGKQEAMDKYDKPRKEYVKGANPGDLETPELPRDTEKTALVWGPALKKQLLGTGIGAVGGAGLGAGLGAAAGAAASGEGNRLKGALTGGLGGALVGGTGGAAIGTVGGYAIPRLRAGMRGGLSGADAAKSVVEDLQASMGSKFRGAASKVNPSEAARQNAARAASMPPTPPPPRPQSVVTRVARPQAASSAVTGAASPQAMPKAASAKYLLDQIPVAPKIRPVRADAPNAKYRVKVGMQIPGVFGMPSQTAPIQGITPASQPSASPKVPSMEQVTIKPPSIKTAFAVSQYSGTLGGGTRDIYRSGEFKTAGPPSEKKKEQVKMSAMSDELTKLNGFGSLLDFNKQSAVATTPQGRLYQSQIVGAPKSTLPPGPSIAALSKPVGYGTEAPGATKGGI